MNQSSQRIIYKHALKAREIGNFSAATFERVSRRLMGLLRWNENSAEEMGLLKEATQERQRASCKSHECISLQYISLKMMLQISLLLVNRNYMRTFFWTRFCLCAISKIAEPVSYILLSKV